MFLKFWRRESLVQEILCFLLKFYLLIYILHFFRFFFIIFSTIFQWFSTILQRILFLYVPIKFLKFLSPDLIIFFFVSHNLFFGYQLPRKILMISFIIFHHYIILRDPIIVLISRIWSQEVLTTILILIMIIVLDHIIVPRFDCCIDRTFHHLGQFVLNLAIINQSLICISMIHIKFLIIIFMNFKMICFLFIGRTLFHIRRWLSGVYLPNWARILSFFTILRLV